MEPRVTATRSPYTRAPLTRAQRREVEATHGAGGVVAHLQARIVELHCLKGNDVCLARILRRVLEGQDERLCQEEGEKPPAAWRSRATFEKHDEHVMQELAFHRI